MIKSDVSIHNNDSYGHLGILCFWRQLPKPDTLPPLPRQGLAPLQSAPQITCENQHLPNSKLPFSKSPFSLWNLEKTKLSRYKWLSRNCFLKGMYQWCGAWLHIRIIWGNKECTDFWAPPSRFNCSRHLIIF